MTVIPFCSVGLGVLSAAVLSFTRTLLHTDALTTKQMSTAMHMTSQCVVVSSLNVHYKFPHHRTPQSPMHW